VNTENKNLIGTATEEIGLRGNFDIIPDLFANNFALHFLPGDTTLIGLESLKDSAKQCREALHDLTPESRLVVAENDLVAVWTMANGTHTGPLFGFPPTENRAAFHAISIFRTNDGKIAEQWLLPDLFSLFSQIGVISSLNQADIDISFEGPIPTDTYETSIDIAQKNKELALKANELIWNQGRFETLETMFAIDFVQHFLPSGTESTGVEALQRHTEELRQAFPDWSEVINLVVAEGNFVVLQYTSTGTNQGPFSGRQPTGRKIRISEITVFRMAKGKIAEQWLLPDLYSLQRQLGFESCEQA